LYNNFTYTSIYNGVASTIIFCVLDVVQLLLAVNVYCMGTVPTPANVGLNSPVDETPVPEKIKVPTIPVVSVAFN
jgi:hypothetical protein